jgi:hypothetical protein
MVCFRDQTFCASDCTNSRCHRYFGPDDRVAARTWWGSPGAPIAWSDFSEGCPDYQPPPQDQAEKEAG